MYFNDEKNSTNIDNEFEKKRSFNLDFSSILYNKKLLIGIVVGIILILIIVFILTGNKKKYYLELLGTEDTIIYQNTPFVDEGYAAYDNKGNRYNDQVMVSGQVNTSVVGEYVITYSFNEIVKTRTVSVVSETKHLTYLILNGSTISYLKVGEKFSDPGYRVLDSTNENLRNNVKVTGNVDTSRAGTYKIIYSVKNDLGMTVTAERTVIVMDSDVNISYNKDGFSNDKVVVNIGVINNYFDYILLPNGNRDTRRTTTYSITANGTYKFSIYSKDGSFKEETITINNIDKEKPTGSCSAKYTNGKYTVTTNVNDNLSGIKSFEYYLDNNLKESTNKTSVTMNTAKTSNNIFITVYDKANNSNKIMCTIDNSAYVEPKPSVSSSSQTPSYKPSSSSKYSSSSKSSSSSKQSTSTGGSGSGICPISGSGMTAYLNGRQLSYDEVITMSVGQTITIKLYLPSNCGTPSSYYLTRTTADGQQGWRNYFSGTSSPSVPHNSGKSVNTTTYNWIITANKKTPGGITLSQTSEFRSDKYSFSKHFYRIVVKVQ